jgi:hypothetical protein
MEELRAPGFVRPTAAGLRFEVRDYIGECQFVYQDESIIQDALKRLTYVHRIDHTPEVDDWAVEELLFRLDHLEESSNKGQEHAIHRINAWMALGHEDTPETWG